MRNLKQILWLFAISMFFVNFAWGQSGAESKKMAPEETPKEPQEWGAAKPPTGQPAKTMVALGAERGAAKEKAAADTEKLRAAGYSAAEAEAIATRKPEAGGVTVEKALEEMAQKKAAETEAKSAAAKGEDVGAALIKGTAPTQTKPGFIGKIQQGFSDFASKVKTALTPKSIDATEPLPPSYKEASLTPALTSEESTPREAPPAYPETPAQKGIRAQITKLHDSAVAAINKVTQKTGVSRVPTAAEVTTIKGAVSGLCSTVRTRLSDATQPMRTAMSAQLVKVRDGLNSAIAKLPVNSPQRQTLLTTKGEALATELAITQRETKGALEGRVKSLEVMDKMLRSPASIAMYKTSLNTQINEKVKAFEAEVDDTKKQALDDEIGALRANLRELEELPKQRAQTYAALRQMLSENDVKIKDLDTQIKQQSAELEKLRAQRESIVTNRKPGVEDSEEAKRILDEFARKRETVVGLEKEREQLSKDTEEAKKSMATPATRLKQAQAALKRANTQVKATAKATKLSTNKKLTEFATKFKGLPGVKQFVEGITNTRLLITEIAAGKTPKQALKTVQATVNAAKNMPKKAQQAAAPDIAAAQRLEKDLAGTQAAEAESQKAAVAQKQEAAAAAVEPLPTPPQKPDVVEPRTAASAEEEDAFRERESKTSPAIVDD